MTLPDGVSEVLEDAWHGASARSSLERWQALCRTEHWPEPPAQLERLARVFGASWYFTRFVFYRGAEAAGLLDGELPPALPAARLTELGRSFINGAGDDLQERLDCLRLFKNGRMLQLLSAWLEEQLSEAQLEQALSELAEAVLDLMLELFDLGPGQLEHRFAVLGMGRLAGREMGFGSDLDLIFLHEPGRDGQPGRTGQQVMRILRNIASPSAAGILYEVDMRLRPHGTAGTLITSVQSFVEHHNAERETWERQLMTRCRPVFDPFGLGRSALEAINPSLYARRDVAGLRADIRDMRRRVERELGRPQGRIEIKRGRGGVMDIDFISHYLQLAHGHAHAVLQTGSTRQALQRSAELGLLERDTAAGLLRGYEFLRRVENCLRLFDLKNVSAFSMDGDGLEPLCRAFGYAAGDGQGFLDRFAAETDAIRGHFSVLLGDGQGS